MSDGLSVAAIGQRQQQLEAEIQNLPQSQRDADRAVVEAELEWKRAEAKALHSLAGTKITVAEREAQVFTRCETEWKTYHLNKTAAEYHKNRAKAVYAELTSLASRMKAAMEAGRAHQMWGQG